MRWVSFLIALAAGLALNNLRASDDHVGVCTHFEQGWSVPEIMPLVAKLGVGWIRDGVPWAEVEPEKGQYQIPPRLTAWLDAAHSNHIKVLLLLSYGNKIYDDPFSPDAYARAAAFLATRLADRVDAIEVLNEPNNPDFGPTYGGKWNGKEDDGSVSPYVRAYVKVLTATVAAVKKANPRMLVVGYGAPAPATFRMIALGPPPLLDGITDHPYSGGRTLPELVPYAATTDLVQRDGIATADVEGTYRSQCAMFCDQAAKYGLHAALWNTEWGFSTAFPTPGTPADPTVVYPDTQAVYVVRRLLEARALNVKSFYYDLRDDGGDIRQDWQNFGLVDIHLKPKPGYFAFHLFTKMFAGLEGDGTSDDFQLTTSAGNSRCYAYHAASSSGKWIACWQATPWPGPPMAASLQVKLEIPAGITCRYAEETTMIDGKERALDISTDAHGRRCCVPDFSSAPVVLYFSH